MGNDIGTLSEKSVHRYLKSYLCKDETKHEVIVGKYIADIKIDNHIYEIQTKNFKNLLAKIEYYLSKNIDVTVVYPVITEKYISWLDTVDNSVVDRRKCSYKEHIQDIFKELYWVQNYIANSSIKLKIITLEAEEYKYLDGYGQSQKHKATKIDKVPTKILNEFNIESISDLKIFLPSTLPQEFTSRDFQKCTKSRNKYLGSGLKILRELGVIQIIGKKGNTFIYGQL